MKGLIFALLWFIIFLTITFPILRAKRWKKPFKLFLTVFIATIPPYMFFYRITPQDLYFLPRNLLEPCTVIDFLYGLGIYTLLFHSFWDLIYAGPMGFSAGLMVELEQAGQDGLSTHQLIFYFKREDRTDSIFGRRIPNLIRGGYIIMEEDSIVLTRKGRLISKITLFLKNLICAGEGG